MTKKHLAMRLACLQGELVDQVEALEALQLCLFRIAENVGGLDTLLGNCVDKIKGVNNDLDKLEIELRQPDAVSSLGEESPLMLSGLISRLSGLLSAHGDTVVRLDGEPVGSVEYIPDFQDPASDLPEDYTPEHVNIS